MTASAVKREGCADHCRGNDGKWLIPLERSRFSGVPCPGFAERIRPNRVRKHVAVVPLQRGCGRTAPGAGREVTRRRWCGSKRVGRRRAPGVAAEDSTPGLGTTGCVATGAAEPGGAVASAAAEGCTPSSGYDRICGHRRCGAGHAGGLALVDGFDVLVEVGGERPELGPGLAVESGDGPGQAAAADGAVDELRDREGELGGEASDAGELIGVDAGQGG